MNARAQSIVEYSLTLFAGALFALSVLEAGRLAVDLLSLIVLRQAVADAAAAGAEAGALYPECASTSCSRIVFDAAAGAPALASARIAQSTVHVAESFIGGTTIPLLSVQVCAELQPVAVLGQILAGSFNVCSEASRPYTARRR
jgi:hypothetical protein